MAQIEDLRKQARKLENEIDTKLISLGKLEIGFSPVFKNDSDREPLLSGDNNLDSLSEEIEQLLNELNHVNDKMCEVSNNSDSAGTFVYALQRHRDILQDYKQEFHKTMANVKVRKEREDLLYSVRKEIDTYKTGVSRRSDLYAKEAEHIRNSERLVSEQINIAVETKENLLSQRHHFKRIQTRMHDLSSRFPMINNLVQRIHLRKKRDSAILGGIVILCTFFMLLYTFH